MKKKTPDYGQPSDLWSKISQFGVAGAEEPDPRFRDYHKKPTEGSRNKLVYDFYDAVIRKSFVLGTEGRFTFDEDSYTKNALAFFEQVFLKVTIDTEEDKCITAQIMFADLVGKTEDDEFFDGFTDPDAWKKAEKAARASSIFGDPGLDLADIGLDPKKTSRIYAGMEKNSPSDKIDIHKLHKCGELHVPFDRHNKEKTNETI